MYLVAERDLYVQRLPINAGGPAQNISALNTVNVGIPKLASTAPDFLDPDCRLIIYVNISYAHI